MKKRLSILGLTLVLSAISGCNSYRLGSPNQIPFESIYVKPVSNDSFAPQAQAVLSRRIRDFIIRDGRLTLVADPKEADAVLFVHLTEYNRRTAARDDTDTVMARNFDLELSAEVSLFNRNKGEYYFENYELNERSNAYVDNPYRATGRPNTQSFLRSEYQAMPRLTRELARKIANRVLHFGKYK